MENSQAINLNNEIQYPDEVSIEVADDHVWKAFYSHSYTVLFTCEGCNHEFDIDGWFYRFDTLACPNCKTMYSGVFGQLHIEDAGQKTGSVKARMVLETFEGQKIEILVPYEIQKITKKAGHIVLIVFIKSPDQPGKPWGIIDYSDVKPTLELFNASTGTGSGKKGKVDNRRPKSFLANLLFG